MKCCQHVFQESVLLRKGERALHSVSGICELPKNIYIGNPGSGGAGKQREGGTCQLANQGGGER